MKIIVTVIAFLVVTLSCNRIPLQEDSITGSPYSPVFTVKDTQFKYGPYDNKTKTVTIHDLIKFHGHMCGGLVETAVLSKAALDSLFADTGGVVDRTDLRVASNNSACIGDVLEYLTGARYRFNAHCIDKNLTGDSIIIQKVSTGKAIKASLNKNYFPGKLRELMKKIEAGSFTMDDINQFGKLQYDFSMQLVNSPREKTVKLMHLENFPCSHQKLPREARRKDNDYKDVNKLKEKK